ncbi:RnfABCDGE type electron transport complex subunit G [Pseudomonas peradeniyensis]|uniref:RnfABCDGE type electron transport complex subunit G n=1 Tax=Pseudomonas peradeniyensis TaxID=2745488 RepID=UPI0021D4C038|nr:RnfABCDGE type electron transport complex subunit G [Pseudomonas peradeniyensis]MCU7279899.1 RnfABCDGE type electron transport complex subunit G [Pseudomonas peradeniyensis]
MTARWRSTAMLLLVAGLAIAATLAWQRFTAGPIAEASRQWQEQQWLEVLPPGSYDNRPLQTPVALTEAKLSHSHLLAGYRASLAGVTSAVLLHSSVQGYGGAIELVIAIAPQGRLIGVRVLAQQESPGLGDQLVDPARHWLDQFIGRTLRDTPEQAWAIKRDQGAFDQLAGATVTSWAVIEAIQDALRYFDQHRPALLGETPP